MIAPTACISGVGKSLGMNIKKVIGATGDKHSNLKNKADAVVHILNEEEETTDDIP